MRKTAAILMIMLMIVSSLNTSLWARGGGGRGGGGFGGGGVGGRGGEFGGGGGRASSSHTPSFSTPRSNFGGESRGTGNNFSSAGQNRNVSQNRSGNESFNRGTAGRQGEFNPSAAGKGTAASRSGNFDRPGNRPVAGQHPNFAGQGNRTNFNRSGNQFNQFGHNNVNVNSFNRNFVNRGGWYHGNWHNHWNNGWGRWPNGWGWGGGWGWGAGLATGVALSAIPWSWGYWSYSNPYYNQSAVAGGYNYSQPIMASNQYAQYAASTPDQDQQVAAADQPSASDQANGYFEAARSAFSQGDYQTALAQIDQAISTLPGDPALHEFRGLVLFATKQYQQAAATIYAVLSSGPGWDWTTLSSLYPNVDVYTTQLRALEDYCRANPDSSDARFLLAYEYMTCGETDAAATELKQVVKLNPKDQLSAQLLAGITAPPSQSPPGQSPPEPAKPATPAAPVSATALVGQWNATRPDGGSVGLDLDKDSKFTWKVSQQGKSQEFNGNYTVADNLLILNQNNTPVMVGQVTLQAGKSFNFKLAGDSPNDPGLTFNR
ncbi:MAG TPA: tetratricopeptide repeat protein [Pirellulales bacterium]|jgi:tetratricopeptide (TPR) repeat protein|nr:tetratricopeptide repeat protein [Pirellulales bacterium]